MGCSRSRPVTLFMVRWRRTNVCPVVFFGVTFAGNSEDRVVGEPADDVGAPFILLVDLLERFVNQILRQ